MEEKYIAFKTARGFGFGCLASIATITGFVVGLILAPANNTIAQVVAALILGALIGLPATAFAFRVDRKHAARLSRSNRPPH